MPQFRNGAFLVLMLVAHGVVHAQVVQINTVIPTTGRAGDQISIGGTGFGANQGKGNVWLGSTYGVVVSWSDTQIVAKVAVGSWTGTAKVLQGGVWSNSADFEVLAPSITSVTPTTGVAGSQVTITGTGFGAVQGKYGAMWLGHKYGVVDSWSDTQVVASVASGAESGTAVVGQGGLLSNAVGFIVSSPPATRVSIKLTSPYPWTRFRGPLSIDLEANVTVSGGTVTRVDFWSSNLNGDTLIGSATSAPFRLTWPDVAEGGYELTAVATDSSGATETSEAVTIIVDTDGTTLGVLGEPIATPPHCLVPASPTTIALAAQPGATVHYTMDGSEPTTESPAYVGPIAITRNTRLLARAFQAGWTPSPVLEETYIVDAETPNCTFNVQPESVAVPPEGASAALTVTASDPSCIRTAVSSVPWISLTPVFTIGTGQVEYLVEMNITQAPRESDLTIAGKTVHISQSTPSRHVEYQIKPDRIMLGVGDVLDLQLVDAAGWPGGRAIWSVDNPAIAEVVIDDGVFVRALAVGHTTVRAITIYGTVTSEITVLVALVPDDPAWAIPPPTS